MAIPISDIKAETVAKAFLFHWIARVGVPIRLTSDRGTQFKSQLLFNLNKLLGTHRIRTTAYHPQTNGILERWYRTLKNAIKCQANNHWAYTLLSFCSDLEQRSFKIYKTLQPILFTGQTSVFLTISSNRQMLTLQPTHLHSWKN